MTRAFYAVLPDEGFKKSIYAILKDGPECYQRLAWEPREKWHLTLRWLGDLNDLEIEKAIKILEKVVPRQPKMLLEVDEIAMFPDDRPYLIVARLKDNPGLSRLWNEISRQCENENLGKSDNRDFSPHLTLARLKTDRNTAIPKMRNIAASFTAESVALMRSVLSASGSAYKILGSVNLKND
ncbi:MAG: RNA 2',3'-cyclic phosphodiesterase [Patescibacteria group bacterium]|nr:RNA 2',3'-cyclic phosphodiesterase [Patescibacteria group bacterium]